MKGECENCGLSYEIKELPDWDPRYAPFVVCPNCAWIVCIPTK